MELLIDQGKHSGLQELSSKFYTVIPHSFGRQRPPVINTREVLQLKMDMLAVRNANLGCFLFELSSFLTFVFANKQQMLVCGKSQRK